MKSKICKECGTYLLKTKSVTPGSRFVEVLLVVIVPVFLFMYVPGRSGLNIWAGLIALCFGAVYGRWRQRNKREVCPKCESTELVPTSSPIGQRLLREHHPDNLDLQVSA